MISDICFCFLFFPTVMIVDFFRFSWIVIVLKCVPLFFGFNTTTGVSRVLSIHMSNFLVCFQRLASLSLFPVPFTSYNLIWYDMTNINFKPLDLFNSLVSAFHLPCCFCTHCYCYYPCWVQAFCFVFLLGPRS